MKVFITGGAGFIGCNAAARYIKRGDKVVVVDDLSRAGSSRNLDWLRTVGEFEFLKVDITNSVAIARAVSAHADMNLCLHLAAQVAVTTSVTDPRNDFLINALGTFNLLEAIRAARIDPVLIYSSTNKVYGGMEDVAIRKTAQRYEYAELTGGVSEQRGLDFHSPYGCSKGAADQYVRDYSRIYGMRTVTFRQSCIYGYRQFGVEDQGWVAWFTIAGVLDKPITIYGDGMQVRDVLFIDDLVDAYDAAAKAIDRTAGQVYNIGGGPANTMSLHELLDMLRSLTGKPIEVSYADWRPGDQPVFICDISRAAESFGWKPAVGAREGVERLYRWVSENREMFVSMGKG